MGLVRSGPLGGTDQDGRFVIEDVSSDRRWILSVRAEEYVDAESDPFKVAAGETKEVNVEMTGGGHLEGRVVDDHGQFVSGARVRIGHIPADRAGQSRMRAWEVDRYLGQRIHFTDDEGRFRAENLTPGMTVVKVEREGYITFYKRNVVIRADETYENYNVAMSKGDVMEGTVRGADGRPLEGAFVAVTTTMPGDEPEEGEEANEDIEPSLSGRSDQDGRFLIENIPPGVYNVVVWFAPGHKGWGRDQEESAIRRGASSAATNVEFRLVAADPGEGFPGRGGGR